MTVSPQRDRIGRIVLAMLVAAGILAAVINRRGTPAESDSIAIVAAALNPTSKLGVTASELRVKPNPKGAGIFVYVPRTEFYGVTRPLLWLSIDGSAYALNGPSKTLTPSLRWPREADEAVWATTNLNRYSPAEAISLVWAR